MSHAKPPRPSTPKPTPKPAAKPAAKPTPKPAAKPGPRQAAARPVAAKSAPQAAARAKPPAARAALPTSDGDTRHILDALRRIVRDLRQPPRAAAPTPGRSGSRQAPPALGPARLFVLQLLAEHGPLAVGELALRTHTDPSSVSVVAQELVMAGLAERHPDPADRRRALLDLTRAGASAVRTTAPAAPHRLATAIDALGAARRRTLAQLLTAVVDASGSDPAAPLFFEDPPTPIRPKRGAP